MQKKLTIILQGSNFSELLPPSTLDSNKLKRGAEIVV